MPWPGEPPQPGKKSLFGRGSELLRYSSLGLEMGVAIVVGLLIGLWLDRLLGTRPWLTLLFLGFGIAAGFKNLVALARREAGRKDDGGDDEPS